jgi:integrase
MFQSLHAQTITAFIELQRLRGYSYEYQTCLLHHFDRYLCECGYRCPWLEQAVVEQYVVRRRGCTAYSQFTMLSVIRSYSRFLHLRYPQSHVLQTPPTQPKRPSRFYLYSHEELAALMEAAATLGPEGSIRPHTVRTLIGLLYVTGLRISEALGLNVEDLDTDERVLFVRKGKFGKDRYVPLADSTVDALLAYRQMAGGLSNDTALFISLRGSRLSYKTVGNIFRRLLYDCGIASGKPWPRLHDLRHTYAVDCLCQWYEQGKDVNAMLPVLSTVMGHVKVSCTQVYLHVPAQLRDTAAAQFYKIAGTHVLSEETS